MKTPQSQAARPPGHQLVSGVDLADGHLTLQYEDDVNVAELDAPADETTVLPIPRARDIK